MKTEKVSVNLNPVELGQIDCLVDRGLFDSRSDFMRSAARKTLEGYNADLRQFIEQDHLESDDAEHFLMIGVLSLGKTEITRAIASGKKMCIRIIGLLSIANGVTPEEIKQVVQSCKVYGKLVASKEVKEALKEVEA